MENLAIVIVTYKRQELLERLLRSIENLEEAPWRVFVIDNEHSPETKEIVERFANDRDMFVYAPQKSNTGGSGGFSAGVKMAYEMGATWFWLMDDDVEVMPDAIGKLGRWAAHYDVVQGSRLDADGGPFYWQYRFLSHLGIYNPIATSKFDESGCKETNTLCFEGGLFSRAIVDAIGFPDYRFFIYWDDCVYGYLAGKVSPGVVVSDVILRRTREVVNWEVTGVRQLNSSSDMTRFYVMRNRGHMAHYLKMHGDYNPITFAIGTILSFAKEFIRLIVVDRKSFGSGAKRLIAGWKEERAIIHDNMWKPMIEIDPPQHSSDNEGRPIHDMTCFR